MDQSMCQPDQQLAGQQQQVQPMQQQMMYCPIRLVYDTSTPMLVQSGDQLQQNQTIFINPQNPPPWARPQNQVIYVQQFPPNMMPIQQMDPNQMFIQNYNYQQVMPQMVQNIQSIQNMQNLQNMQNIPEQMRQVMVPNNMIQTNMVPTNMVQTNLVQNVIPNNMIQTQTSSQNEAAGQIMNNYGNIQVNPQVNVANVAQNQYTVASNVKEVNIQANQIQNIQNQRAIEIQRQGLYRNVVPQQSPVRPQMPIQVMNPVQNIQQTVQQNQLQQSQIQQIRQPVPQNQSPSQVQYPNIQERRPEVKMEGITYSAVRNGQTYTYRAIQPKPPQYRNVNYQPMNVQTQTLQRQNVPNMSNVNFNPKQVNKVNNPPNVMVPTTNVKTENVPLNRKRKSESPDEIQRKIAANSTVYGSITVTAKTQDKSIVTNVKSNDVGVNTSPVHKVENKKSPVLQINPMEVQSQVKEEFKTLNVQQLTQVSSKGVNTQTDKDKLVRNTVFTQARGRLLGDKPNIPNAKTSSEEMKNKVDPTKTDAIKMDTSEVRINNAFIQTEVPQNFVKPDQSTLSSILSERSVADDIKNIASESKPDDLRMKTNSSDKIGSNTTSTNVNAILNTTNTVTNITNTNVNPNHAYLNPFISSFYSNSNLYLQNAMLNVNSANLNTNNVNFNTNNIILNTSNTNLNPNTDLNTNNTIMNTCNTNMNPCTTNISTSSTSSIITTNQSLDVRKATLESNKQNSNKPFNTSNTQTINPRANTNSTSFNTIKTLSTSATNLDLMNKNSNTSLSNLNTDGTTVNTTKINFNMSASSSNTSKPMDTISKNSNASNTNLNTITPIVKIDYANLKKEDGHSNKVEVNIKKEDINLKKEDANLKKKADLKKEETNLKIESNLKKEEANLKEDSNKKDVTHSKKQVTNLKKEFADLKQEDLKLKTEPNNLVKDEKLEKEVKIEETKDVKKERIECKKVSINEIRGKEIHIVDGSIVKEERDFVLTHVLDGFVIQESNVPFAIRKPLKEKTVNTVETQMSENKETKENFIRDKSKILDICHLNLNEEKLDEEMNEEKEEENINDRLNPFADLKHNIVKSWTVEELITHLSKFCWDETISILREHEIDGESIFLVSKPQLMTIGVSEEHADVICEFVKS